MLLFENTDCRYDQAKMKLYWIEVLQEQWKFDTQTSQDVKKFM